METTSTETTLKDILEQRLTAAEAAREVDRQTVEAKHGPGITKLERQLAAELVITPSQLRRQRRAAAAEAAAKAKAGAPASTPEDAPAETTAVDEGTPEETVLEDDPIPTRTRPQDVRTTEEAVAGIRECQTRAEVEVFVFDLPKELKKATKLATVERLNQLRAKA